MRQCHGLGSNMAGNHLRLIMGIGHDAVNIGPLRQFQRVVDQRLASNLNQRFRPVLGQGLHALAETGRKQH